MRKIINILFVLCLVALPIIVSAYTLLQPLPGLTEEKVSGEGAFTNYLTWLFKFMLVVAGFAAVIQIAIGGIQMIIGGASETMRTGAKSRIWDAIWGLLLALGAWLILFTINPDLAKMKLTIPGIEIEIKAPTGGEIPAGMTNNLKIPSANIRQPGACNGQCLATEALADKLSIFYDETVKLGISQGWWVTEGYPPTVTHKDPCHQNGTCVDIAIKSLKGGEDFCEKVATLSSAAKKAGFSVGNEYLSCGGTAYDTTTGGHLHIK